MEVVVCETCGSQQDDRKKKFCPYCGGKKFTKEEWESVDEKEPEEEEPTEAEILDFKVNAARAGIAPYVCIFGYIFWMIFILVWQFTGVVP